MSLLFKNLRVHQIFGANTDVGKTILTSALVRGSAAKENQVFYLKPISTGSMKDADDEHVKRFVGSPNVNVQADCLYRYGQPVSPHLAVQLEENKSGAQISAPTDDAFVNAVSNHIRKCASLSPGIAHMYVETAGGVHSPTLSGTTQVDSYRPLFLPTILIADPRLGGISSTISSYESLLLRGYIIDTVMILREEYYRNWEYLHPYFAERGVSLHIIDSPPERLADPKEDFAATENFYKKIVPPSREGPIFEVIRHLDDCHARRLSELDSMPQRTLNTIWWPFVQHGLAKDKKDINVIDSAWGDYFTVYKNPDQSGSPDTTSRRNSASLLQPQFDGSASWWTQALGHAHPTLALAAAKAAGRYGHVMFPHATHLPALRLAERLVHAGPGKGWAARAFFSDDGATGMEVALKMALRAFAVRDGQDGTTRRKDLGILGLKGSYHGDTIGAMDACEDTGVYTSEWHNAKGFWFDPPTVAIRKGKAVVTLPSAIAAEARNVTSRVEVQSLGWAYDIPARIRTPLADVYRRYIKRTLHNLQESDGPKIAALVLEPLVMGAGGMIFVDPLFQRVLIDVVRETPFTPPVSSQSSQWNGLPVIFDEVFIGLYRLGFESSGPLLGVYPDISVNAKILTGGLVPLAVTMASQSIFDAFVSDDKVDALLHGHSYTAYPVGCEVANATLDILQKLASSEQWKISREQWTRPAGSSETVPESKTAVWSFWDPKFIDVLSHLDIVDEVMSLGTVLAIKMRDNGGGYTSHTAQKVLESIKTGVADKKMSSAPGGAPFGINYRTLGDVAYFMTSLNTPLATIRSVEDRIWTALETAKTG